MCFNNLFDVGLVFNKYSLSSQYWSQEITGFEIVIFEVFIIKFRVFILKLEKNIIKFKSNYSIIQSSNYSYYKGIKIFVRIKVESKHSAVGKHFDPIFKW